MDSHVNRTQDRSFEVVARLTQSSLPVSLRGPALRQFALVHGWRPSDRLDEYPFADSLSNGHLVVEHGLDNTAVITFLSAGAGFARLDRQEQLKILGISYNNLVDWHLFPDRDGITIVFNRADPFFVDRTSLLDNANCWRADAFDKLIGKRPNPNLKSLDEALIDTISRWKRVIAAEVGGSVTYEHISALFNAVLFVRALEDHRRWRAPTADQQLVSNWLATESRSQTLRECISSALKYLSGQDFPSSLIDLAKLGVFDSLDHETVLRLFLDFYENPLAPYKYDFSLISKHALSRVYERYISTLTVRESPQLTLFPPVPEEIDERSLGGVYTPQYIARFFARYLKENIPPAAFRQLRVTDPACGSGIFLRSLLELQCDVRQDIDIKTTAPVALRHLRGIDINPNACYATRLSLALLHLVLTDRFPDSLTNITHAEALTYFQEHRSLEGSQDAVIANPPFIKWDHMHPDLRVTVLEFMGEAAKGKTDMFLAHLRLGMELVKQEGFLLYVLPHSFLIGRNARHIRQDIAGSFWVRFFSGSQCNTGVR